MNAKMDKRKDIFVTDDDPETLSVLNKYFEDTEFQVRDFAASGKETIEKLHKKVPDILLFNIAFDEQINDSNTSHYIIKEFDIPVIYLVPRKNIFSTPTSNYTCIKKPIDKNELLNTLELAQELLETEKIKTSHFSLNTQFDEIKSKYGEPVLNFIKKYSSIINNRSIIISTRSRFNIKIFPPNIYKSLANVYRINDIKYLNKFFESVNDILPIGGTFIGYGETKGSRKKRLLKKFPPVINYIFYSFDFIFTRVFPKLPITKRIYFFITKGQNRILTRPEILGRLYSCGFEVLDEQFINNNLFFAVKKIRNPFYDYNPTYGPLVKMRRVGKGGKIIGVYKFRTMHPYSEYLHDYMLKHHGYGKKGKPANDFRITTWGKILRRFWLDELPQIINVLKGEMKLVGVRPISLRAYNDYPEEIKKLRSKYKPGCVPPYVALLMQNMADSIKAEEIYLKDKEKHPYTTDIKYLFKAIYNILTNKIRSA